MGIIQAEQTEVKTKDPNALVAKNMFTKVSVKYPASVTAQSAMIARICREQDIEPLMLRDALLDDDEFVRNIVENANIANQKRGKDTVSEDRVRGIIKADFDRAMLYMDVPLDALSKIEAKYEKFKTIVDPDKREDKFIEFSMGIIEIEFEREERP